MFSPYSSVPVCASTGPFLGWGGGGGGGGVECVGECSMSIIQTGLYVLSNIPFGLNVRCRTVRPIWMFDIKYSARSVRSIDYSDRAGCSTSSVQAFCVTFTHEPSKHASTGPVTGPMLLPVPGLYWAIAASIGPVQARYWHLMAWLQGAKINWLCGHIELLTVWYKNCEWPDNQTTRVDVGPISSRRRQRRMDIDPTSTRVFFAIWGSINQSWFHSTMTFVWHYSTRINKNKKTSLCEML